MTIMLGDCSCAGAGEPALEKLTHAEVAAKVANRFKSVSLTLECRESRKSSEALIGDLRPLDFSEVFLRDGWGAVGFGLK